MSKLPTIRVKSNNPDHHKGFFIRNADDLRYGEELFMADEFERLGEHSVRLKIESLSSDDAFVVEGNVWLRLKSKERAASADASRSTREEEVLSIAKEANRLASEANATARLAATAATRSSRYAMYAAIIAVTAMIIDNHDQIIEFIFNSP